MFWLVEYQSDSWPAWLILLTILGIIFGYMIPSGIAQKAGNYDMDKEGPIGLLWPILGPWLLGEFIVGFLTRPKLPSARVVKE